MKLSSKISFGSNLSLVRSVLASLTILLLGAVPAMATWGTSYSYGSSSWGYNSSSDYCRNGGGSSYSKKSGYHQQHSSRCYERYDDCYYKNTCNDEWYYKSNRDHCWYRYDSWKDCWNYECGEGDFECDEEEPCETYRDLCLVDKGDNYFYDSCGGNWYYFYPSYDCWYIYKNGCWTYFKDSDLFDECATSSNEAPSADPKSAETEINVPVTVTLSGSDPDGDTITYALAGGPQSGAVSLSGNTVTYTPNAGFVGVDTFTYKTDDGLLSSAPAQVTITVIQPNRPPLAVDLSYETATGVSIEVVLDGSDPDGDDLSYEILSQPAHGTLVDIGGGVFQYLPDNGYNGLDTFTYESSDGVLQSSVATVTITIACDDSSDGEGVFWTYHASSINGTVIGSVRHLTGDDFNFNSGGLITGDIITPGTPKIRYNGRPVCGEVIEGDGSRYPSGYRINLNNGSQMRNLVTRTDGESLPSIENPSNPSGWQNVTLNSSWSTRPSAGDFWKVRNLNINSNAGNVDVPPGAYGNFVANSGTSFTLGVAGSNVPAVYSFENLQWNSNARINVVGPIIIRTRNQVQANGPAGNEAHPEWMVWQISQGGFVANSKAEPIYAYIYAPNGRVTVNNKATICGATYSEDLTVNSGGTLSYCGAPVECGNEAPIAVDRSATILHDTSAVITLEGSDPEGATVSYALVGGPSNGTVSLAGNSVTYVPATGFVGVDSFTYLVNDGELDSDLATVTITVTNTAPVAIGDTGETDKETPISFTLVASDADGDTLSYALAGGAAHGSVSLAGNVATYTPEAGFAGVDAFTFVANDGLTSSNVATVTITVRNIAPTADPKSAITDLGVPVSIDLSGADADGDSISFELVSQPNSGSVSLSGATAVYTPASNFVGTVSFTYRTFDGIAYSAPAQVTVTVLQPNRPPLAVSAELQTNVNEPIDVIFDGSDPDGDSLSYTLVSGPAHGTLTDLGGGLYSYQPNSGYVGEDVVTYTSFDGELTSEIATIVILVICPEVGSSEGDGIFWSQYPASIDGKVEGSIYQLTGQGFNLNSTANITGDILVPGTPHVNVNGSPNWQGVVEGSGSASPSGYWITVNSGATLRNIVTRTDAQSLPGVTAPTSPSSWNWANVNNASDPNPNWSQVGNVNFNANSGVRAVPAGAYGSFNLGSGTGIILGTAGATTPEVYSFQQLNVNSGSRIEVVGPVIVRLAQNTSFNGPAGAEGHSDWLVLEVNNGGFTANSQGQTIYAHVYAPRGEIIVNNNTKLCGEAYGQRIRVNSGGLLTFCGEPASGGDCGNEPPVAEDLEAVTLHDVAIDIPLDGFDPEGAVLSYTLVDGPLNGTVTLIDGVATYVPAPGFVGVDTFTYLVNDGELDSEVATVTVTVTNGAPVAYDDAGSTPKNTPIEFTLVGVDPDGDDLAYSLVALPVNGTVSLVGTTAVYTPAAGFAGTDTFTFIVNDGLSDSNIATITVTVLNQAPLAVDKAASTLKNTPVAIALEGSDPDGDAITYALASVPSNGTVSLSGGIATYTPGAGFAGVDTFTYVTNDGLLDSAPATVTVTVVNRAPSATDLSVTTARGTAVAITLVGSDPDGDSLSFNLITAPAHGSVALVNGVVTYTPDAGYAGTDSFTYTSFDGMVESAVATVSIVVQNHPPTAVSKSLTTAYQTPIQVVLSGADPDGDALTFSIGAGPTYGTLSVVSGDIVTYTPENGFAGTDTFTYVSNDGLLNSSYATVTITVENGNLPPSASNITTSTPRDTPVAITLLGTDPDGDALTYFVTSQPTHGTISLVNGVVTYTPAAGYIGFDTFRYVSFDGRAQSAPATVTITIFSEGNLPPTTENINVFTAVNTPVNITLLGFDPNGDSLVYQVTGASSGQVQQISPGVARYTPANNFLGTATFRYRASDGTAVSNISTVTVTIGDPTNSPPVVNAGPDVTYLLSDTLDLGGNAVINLDGAVSDDGLPTINSLSSNWTLVSRPGTGGAVFTAPGAADTSVSITNPVVGYYTFRLTATDTVYTVSDEVVIRLKLMNEPPVPLTELRMNVDAVDVPVTIKGVVTDDGLPLGAPLTSAWTYIDGPGSVIFDDPSQPTTTAIFTAPGIYLLELSADDTEYTAYDILTVYVDVDCIIEVPSTAIAWWTGNRSFVDYVERRHDALPEVGTPAFTDGVVSLGFLFDGQSGMRSVATTVSNVGTTAAGGFSIEGWFSPDVLAAMPLISWANDISSGVSLASGASGELIVTLPIQGGSTIQRSYPGVFVANTFRHVAVTYNSTSGILRVYVDGVQIGSGEAIGVFNFVTFQDIWIGTKPGTNPTFYRGVIDELTIYRGTILNATEVFDIFRSGYVGKCGDPSNI